MDEPEKRRRQLFRERDLAKAMRVAAACGLTLSSVKLEADGSIVLEVAQTSVAEPKKRNPWD